MVGKLKRRKQKVINDVRFPHFSQFTQKRGNFLHFKIALGPFSESNFYLIAFKKSRFFFYFLNDLSFEIFILLLSLLILFIFYD